MQTDQILIIAILASTVAAFLWGRWRHDLVAGGALMACVLAGVVAPEQAFAGFGHPAVITVACVLVLSRGLQTSGAVDALARVALPAKAGPMLSIAALTALAAVLSGFMNNVGALALLMPVALQIARKRKLAPGQVLMPLAFGSILGGMTTLIGTPPNLIVSGYRASTGEAPFAMFDFSPVGVAVAGAGVLLIVLGGWKLVPVRREAAAEGFDPGAYLTEVRVPEGARAVGRTLSEIERSLDQHDAQVLGIVQAEFRVHAPHPSRVVRAGDVLVIEADAEALSNLLSELGLKLEEDVPPPQDRDDTDDADSDAPGDARGDHGAHARDEGRAPAPVTVTDSTTRLRERRGGDAEADRSRDVRRASAEDANDEDDGAGDDDGPRARDPGRTPHEEIVLQEIVVLPGSGLSGRSATELDLRTHHGINVLAISRAGIRSRRRLRSQRFQEGDLLLVQGTQAAISGFAAQFGAVPLAERALRMPDRRKAITASLVLAAAIALTAFGLLPAAVAFALGVVASMALRTVPPREVYEAVDWPVIVLLAALIPVAGAMESTGTADLLARGLFDSVAQGHPVLGLVLVMVVTMTLSDLMNNAATAAVMCPIAVGAATTLGVDPDPYLMAVAIGASCAFLTPIGHQNNTLILGPGGFRFSDYWRLGLPVQLVVLVVSIPLLLRVWPL
ncbi:SLC13 family permease [Luteimonas kalidii]|uniref:SLC13 family permease n=1 Tax=Luteimonas kalidii TaxID=3042025 RepID=A0ABT6JQ26_9GAMM|nr:SLC13 family permease [Luteimonas kalidii]MDH5832789.1 SLC13 family permease [Luteimonas kalidii]